MVERIVEEKKTLEDGKYEGVIIAVEYRNKPHEYLDLIIECEGMKLKCGYPFKIMRESYLGKKMMEFGAKLITGEPIDPDPIFIGKKCSFLVQKAGIYSNIIPASVKPIIEIDAATKKEIEGFSGEQPIPTIDDQ